MYDQVGFYSENGAAGAGAAARSRARTWASAASISPTSFAAGRRRPARRGARRFGGQFSGHLQPVVRPLAGTAKSASSRKRHRSRVRPEYRFLAGHSRHAGSPEHRTARKRAPPATAPAHAGGANAVCPECNGSGNVTQMAGAMRFSLTCPRCDGTGRLRNACPTCHGDGRISRTETVEVRIPAGAQQGSRCASRARATPAPSARPPGDLYITVRVEAASVLPPRRRRYRDHGAGPHRRSRPGHQDRSAHHRRARAAQDSAGNQERPEIPPAREGRAQLAHRTRAAIRSSR